MPPTVGDVACGLLHSASIPALVHPTPKLISQNVFINWF